MKKVGKLYYDENGNFIIRPYLMKDFAAIYGVSTKTVHRWIVKLLPGMQKKRAKYFRIDQVNDIVNAIGIPKKKAA